MNFSKKIILFSLVLMNSFLLVSCDDDDDDVNPIKSREIKFEVTGNFSGRMDATFITASGGGTNETISALPWTKSLTYSNTVQSTGITVGGGGGTPGQTIIVKVFAGGNMVSQTPGTANSAGIVVVASPSYIF